MATTTTTATQSIRIVGDAARDISLHVRATLARYLSAQFWTEVQAMSECRHGCKLYVRRRGAVLQYRLIHSASYGCSLGWDDATRMVLVSVAPKATV